MIWVANARLRSFNPPLLPEGYYGNAFTSSGATSTAEELIESPVEYAIKLIRKAKLSVTREYIQSTVDTLADKNRTYGNIEGSYVISDARRLGFSEPNFGWGNAIYGGPPRAFTPEASFYLPHRNKKGDIETLLHICLQPQAMDRFVKEAQKFFPFMRLLRR
ncbi:(Z)-3-hexen-1-ol acetyltransferase [Euphorbia peplus]|nr:(Z)-3-hexen-1-ol acetyltransferase [Euphorbia peplus]